MNSNSYNTQNFHTLPKFTIQIRIGYSGFSKVLHLSRHAKNAEEAAKQVETNVWNLFSGIRNTEVLRVFTNEEFKAFRAEYPELTVSRTTPKKKQYLKY